MDLGFRSGLSENRIAELVSITPRLVEDVAWLKWRNGGHDHSSGFDIVEHWLGHPYYHDKASFLKMLETVKLMSEEQFDEWFVAARKEYQGIRKECQRLEDLMVQSRKLVRRG